MPNASEYLRLALKELSDQRADLDRQIAVIKRTIEELDGTAPTIDTPANSERETITIRHVRSIRDIALDLARDSEVFTIEDVMQRAKAEGNESQYPSVSSMLSRMRGERLLDRGPRRGTYVLARRQADGPAEARPSEPSNESHEGGTDHASVA